jgi:uncharacterized protein YggE
MRALLTIVLIALVAPSVEAQENRRQPNVSASGSVDIAIPPNRAAVILTLAGEGIDLGAAAAAADSVADRLIAVASRHDLPIAPWGGSYGENVAVRRMMPGQADVRTTRDYLARSGILLEVYDLTQMGSVLTDIAKANIARSIQLVYFVDEANAQLRDAHSRAAVIARQRATSMAQELGGQLGPLISLSTPQGYMPPVLQRLQVHDGINGPLNVSDVLIRVIVHGSWEFVIR